MMFLTFILHLMIQIVNKKIAGHISGRPGVPPKGHLAGVELSERVKNEVADRGGEEIKKLSPALSAVTTSPSISLSLS